MTRVPWIVVTWKTRPLGPGAAVSPQQTEGAAIFPTLESARAWISDRYLKGDLRVVRFNIYDGDPVSAGAGPTDWQFSTNPVYAAEGLL